MAKVIKLTDEGLKKLESELEYLKTEGRKDIAEKIKIARGYGDLSENSEYDEAKNEQAKLYGRIADIENVLANAIVIDEQDENAGVVTLGATLKVRDLDTDEIEIYAIVGSQEADPGMGRISDDSPFGRACLGRHIGETVVYEAPACEVRYEILGVEK